LKEIANEYNMSLDEFLNNKKHNSNKILFIILAVFIVILMIGIFYLSTMNDNFEFKTLDTSCKEFEISGSIAYNKDKSSIYISHINYCGKEDIEVYEEIKCSLYEEKGNKKTEIESCDTKENITLENFLQDVKFNIDNYNAECSFYKDNTLYLEINAKNQENKTITYKVPLSLNDNC